MGLMKKVKKKKSTKPKSYKYDPSEWDETKSVAVTPEPRMKSGVSTSIRLPKEMVTKLKKVAKRKGDVGYQTLLKIWIAERLEKESA